MKKKTVTMILLTLGATTFVNADNGFVYGSYDEQDFFEHGTIVK